MAGNVASSREQGHGLVPRVLSPDSAPTPKDPMSGSSEARTSHPLKNLLQSNSLATSERTIGDAQYVLGGDMNTGRRAWRAMRPQSMAGRMFPRR